MYLKNYIKIIDFTMRKTNKTLKFLFPAKEEIFPCIQSNRESFLRLWKMRKSSEYLNSGAQYVLDRTRIHDEWRKDGTRKWDGEVRRSGKTGELLNLSSIPLINWQQ